MGEKGGITAIVGGFQKQPKIGRSDVVRDGAVDLRPAQVVVSKWRRIMS